MSVLTLAGKAIDWANPPSPTYKVMWSGRTTSGRPVIGSLRTIAHLDHLNTLALKKFGRSIEVMQGPYNTGVAASAGTHDYDACLDVRISGVDWLTQQQFFRANGAGAYYRSPAQGFTPHIHYFTLPPLVRSPNKSLGYKVHGFTVGAYVDGGLSRFGTPVASSQIADYYGHRTALAGHAADPTWFPPNINATIFDLPAYIRAMKEATVIVPKGRDEVTHFNSHAPLARLGGEAGKELWEDWEASVRARMTAEVRDQTSAFITCDDNKRGGLPNFGKGLRRLGGVDIDLIGFRRAVGGARVKIIKRKRVNLTIDGHDAHGVKVRVTFPSGERVTYWIVTVNIGRKGANIIVVRNSLKRIRKAFGPNAVYGFQEIDEVDASHEHAVLDEVFPRKDFERVGWATRTPLLVGRRRLKVVDSDVTVASFGMAKVSPQRMLVQATIVKK